MDPVPTTASVTRNTSMLMYEPPLVLDADGEVQPMLAEDYEMSEDNTVLTLTMREDVPFHNGETMTVDDVVASLERWAEVSNLGVDYFSEAEIEAVDEQTVTIMLPEPMALAPVMLAEPAQLPMIMPAEILDDLDEASASVEEHIGTGPYQ